MSTLESEGIALVKLGLEDLVSGKTKIEGFLRIGESLRLQLPLAERNLRAKEEVFGDLHSPHGFLKKCREFLFFEKARRELQEARRRVEYIKEASALHEAIARKVTNAECCCAQHTELLLRLFIRHLLAENRLFEDLPDSSLPFILQKANELKQFIEEVACFKADYVGATS